MAATNKGVWDVQEVRDKQLASEWPYVGGPSERTAVYTWGLNEMGNLGQNNTTTRSSPVQVPGVWTNWTFGQQQAYGIKSDGTMWAMGQDSDAGELGQNETPGASKSSPTQIGTNTNWKTAVSAKGAVVSVKTDGTIWAWGDNEQGMMGQNQGGTGPNSRSSPTQIGTNTNWSSDVKRLSAGYRSFYNIKTNGELWVWGFHGYGALGLNNWDVKISSPAQVGTNTNWSCVDGAVNTTFSVKTDGTLWSCGYNSDGALGQNEVGVGKHKSSPTQIGTNTNWSLVRAGRYYGVATKTDGTLWSWGANENGQLGLGDRQVLSSPTQIPGTWYWVEAGYRTVFGQKTDGTLWSWGHNNKGQAGTNNNFANDNGYSSPTQVGTDSDWNIESVSRSGGIDPNVGGAMRMPS